MTSADVLAKLSDATSFTVDEINTMYANFSKIAASAKDAKMIEKVEFRRMMGCQGDSGFIDGLFRMFDKDGNGGIDFSEFVESLAIYQNKAKNITDAEKKRLFFKIYDADGDGEISEADLTQMLMSCFQSSFMAVQADDVKDLVKATFQKYDLTARGTIDLPSYSKLAFSHRSGYI